MVGTTNLANGNENIGKADAKGNTRSEAGVSSKFIPLSKFPSDPGEMYGSSLLFPLEIVQSILEYTWPNNRIRSSQSFHMPIAADFH